MEDFKALVLTATSLKEHSTYIKFQDYYFVSLLKFKSKKSSNLWIIIQRLGFFVRSILLLNLFDFTYFESKFSTSIFELDVSDFNYAPFRISYLLIHNKSP